MNGKYTSFPTQDRTDEREPEHTRTDFAADVQMENIKIQRSNLPDQRPGRGWMIDVRLVRLPRAFCRGDYRTSVPIADQFVTDRKHISAHTADWRWIWTEL